MKTIKLINKDILADIDENRPTVILHGCNCFHTMGGGIAAYLRKVHPSIYLSDVAQTKRGDADKLGTFSTTIIDTNLVILNCYTQFSFSRDKMDADYEAIRQCLRQVKKLYTGCEIRSPQMGCGLAGGDWEDVAKIYAEELEGTDYHIYFKRVL